MAPFLPHLLFSISTGQNEQVTNPPPAATMATTRTHTRSGRIGWVCARALNRLMARAKGEECFRYLLSGGDEALIISKELPEDDPQSVPVLSLLLLPLFGAPLSHSALWGMLQRGCPRLPQDG